MVFKNFYSLLNLCLAPLSLREGAKKKEAPSPLLLLLRSVKQRRRRKRLLLCCFFFALPCASIAFARSLSRSEEAKKRAKGRSDALARPTHMRRGKCIAFACTSFFFAASSLREPARMQRSKAQINSKFLY